MLYNSELVDDLPFKDDGKKYPARIVKLGSKYIYFIIAMSFHMQVLFAYYFLRVTEKKATLTKNASRIVRDKIIKLTSHCTHVN